MIVVVLPTVLTIIYACFIEANVYTSSAQFMMKSANESSTLTGLGSFLQSTGISTTPNDSYTVDAYLMSRDAVQQLEKNPGLRAIYGRPEGDFITRFPNFLFGPSFENLFAHYTEWVKADLDSSSDITTLTVNSYRPGDSQAIAERLLGLSEDEVNRLNDRIRNDALKGARREVAQLQDRLIQVQNEVTAFRNSHQLLDPNQTSTQSVSLLATLEGQLVTARATLNQMQVAAPRSPQLPGLRARVAALQAQVAAETAKGAGGSTSLAPKIADYQALLLRQQFLQQMLQSAVTSLEAAEATVQQKQLYLARVAEPSVADRPTNDVWSRIVQVLIIFISVLLVYWVGRMLGAVLKEHLGK